MLEFKPSEGTDSREDDDFVARQLSSIIQVDQVGEDLQNPFGKDK